MTENTPGVKEGILEQANAEADDSAGGGGSGAADARGDAASSEERRSLDDILGYKPFPKQRQFHKSPAKYRLFGGAAGPGKSKALLMEAVVQALDHPNVNTLLLRRTFPELETSLLHYFRRDVPRELYVAFHESKHLVEWANGSTTRFGYCASEHDVYQYQGAEYLFIGIDELTLFTLRQWQFLTSRNRCPVPGTFSCMAGATNPGNIGHAWVKALWIDKQPAPGMERPEEYDAQDYDFIPARFFDNPIYAADKNYQKTLLALPTNLKRAFFDGDWEVFAGQYFDRFDLGRNTARAEEIEWQPWWPRWISIDWGFEHPAATYWHAQAPGSLAVSGASEGSFGLAGNARAQPNSCVVTYREYVTHRTSPRDLAREIIARSVGSEQRSPARRIFRSGRSVALARKRARKDRRDLPLAGRFCAAHGRCFDRGADGGCVRGGGISTADAGGRRSHRRLDADVPNAGCGGMAADGQLRGIDSNAADVGAGLGAD